MRWVAIRKNLLSSTSKIVSVWSPSSQFSDSRVSLGASKVGCGHKRLLRGLRKDPDREATIQRGKANPPRRLPPEVPRPAISPFRSECTSGVDNCTVLAEPLAVEL